MKRTMLNSKRVLYVWNLYDKETQVLVATETMEDVCPVRTTLGMCMHNAYIVADKIEKIAPHFDVKCKVIGA